LVQALSLLVEAGVNVLIAVCSTVGGRVVLEAAERMDADFLAHSSLGSAIGQADVSAGYWQGEYLFTTSFWSATSPVVGQFSGLSSPRFADKFFSRTGLTATTLDATVYSMFSVLCKSIERADTLDTHAVRVALEENDLTELIGSMRYDAKCAPCYSSLDLREV
jgi:ABC-type branched-subunit amino acid transport system substrate-binding protein